MRHLPVLMLLCSACVPSLYTEAANGPWEWEEPENSWPLTPPPDGTVGKGYNVGQVVPDFRLKDQFGDDVSLWQFYGNVILLDVSTVWCSPCQELATHTEETVEAYADDDFIYVTVLQEDIEGNPTKVADQVEWADLFGISSPVLGDPDKSGTGAAIERGQYPAVIVIDRDLTVRARVNPPEDARVRAAIDSAL